jgi:hypothetical protein
MVKSGAQRFAAEYGIMIVAPDTDHIAHHARALNAD